MLIIAVDDPAKTIEIVETAKKNFPHLQILARSHSYLDAYELFDMGVEKVYRETFDTALRIGTDALTIMGQRAFKAHRASLRRDKDLGWDTSGLIEEFGKKEK